MTGFDIWNELGNIYFKVGAFEEAIDAYNKAIELDFRIGWLYSNLGFAYAHKGKFAEAILEYEKSIELLNTDEDKAVSWSRLGEAYRQLHQYDQAVLAYQKAVELAPQDASFNAGLSAVQEQIGQLDEAVPQAVSETPIAIEAEEPQVSMVMHDVVLADLEEAENAPAVNEDEESDVLATEAVSRLFEEETIPAMVSDAADLVQDNEASDEEPFEEAARPVMQIVGEAPSPEPDVALQESVLAEVAAEEANSIAETVMDALPESIEEQEAVAERSSEAVVLEEDEWETTTVNALLSSGIEMWRKGDHEKASETLQAALEAAGRAENKWLEALSHNAMALVKTELGKLEEAIGSYTQAMQLAPEKIIPWNNIGHLYSKLDRNDEAMEAFLKAIEHNPEDFVSWDGLGDIYAKLGRLNDAIAAYQLGNVFGKQRRAEDALTAYQMIVEPVIDTVIESVMENPPADAPADNIWVAEVAVAVDPGIGDALAQADDAVPAEESPLESVAPEVAMETPQAIEESAAVEPVLAVSDEIEVQTASVIVDEETGTEELAPGVPESIAVDVALTDEIPAEAATAETSQLVAVEAASAVIDETDVQAASVVEETVTEEIALAVPESVADEVVVTDESPAETSAEILQPIEASAAVEAVSADSAETRVQAASVVEETVAEEITPVVAESIADTVVLTDEIPAESVTETAQPAAVEAVASADSETQAEVVVVDEEAVIGETVSALPESVSETISNTPLPALDGPVAIEHELISVDIAPSEMEPAQAGMVEQPAEATQMPIPELVDETVPAANASSVEDVRLEPESAVSVEETVMEAQAEEILENASSSIELSRLTSAIAAYKKVTEINPENDRAWDSLGNLYRASERYGDATAAFERAIFLRPNKEVYHYHLGLVYAAEKHYEDAIGAFQKVIELNPEYTFAHCALAGYFRKLGQEAQAQEHIEKALPKMTSEKEYDRACFAAICGNPDEAIELLKIALEKKQTSLDWVRRDPDLDFIRDDRRFKTLIARNGSWSERLSDVFSKQLAWSPNK